MSITSPIPSAIPSRIPDTIPGGIAAASFAVTPQVYIGPVRLDGYSGSACRIVRASDSAEKDIGFSGNQVDIADALVFTNGTTPLLTTLYDQTGNGFHYTQTVQAEMPRLYRDLNGVPVFGFDGDRNIDQGRNVINTSIAIGQQDFEQVFALRPGPSIDIMAYTYWPHNANDAGIYAQDGSNPGLRMVMGGVRNSTLIPQAQPTVIGWFGDQPNLISGWHLDGETQTFAFNNNTTRTGNIIGASGTKAVTFDGRHDTRGMVLFDSPLTSGQRTLVVEEMQRIAGRTTGSRNLVFDGDSRISGYGAGQNNTTPWRCRKILGSSWDMWNMGIGGATISDLNTRYATYVDPLYDAARLNVLCSGGIGINDFAAGMTSGDYLTALASYHTAASASGFEHVACTVIDSTALTAGERSELETANAAILASPATYGDAIADIAALDEVAGVGHHYGDAVHAAIAAEIATAVSTLI